MQFCNVPKMNGYKFIVNRDLSDFCLCKILNSCTKTFNKNLNVKLWKLLKYFNRLLIGYFTHLWYNIYYGIMPENDSTLLSI